MRRSTLVLALATGVLGACPAPAPAPRPLARAVVTAPDAAPAPPPTPVRSPAQPTLRLPKNFVALGYDARLAIDPAKPSFDGEIAIAGTVVERSAVIWLHGRRLDVHHATATSATGATVELAVAARGVDLLELRASPPLDAGAWTLALSYRGAIDDTETTGAFREQVAGAAYVFTQFEALYARRVFPCIDEPDTKVPWKLALDVPAALVAASNTAIERDTVLASGARRVEFARTKPLPSYLVAFVVGPFAIVDAGTTRRGTPVRVIALAGRAADAGYAAKTGARVLDLLEDWFGIPYPYDKLDLVAVPLTVGFGAMENAGLVTFTERLVLIDAKHPSWERRYRWIRVAAHELAHQWFGNLVTAAWWDDIWLNEGFANWLQGKIVAQLEPAWHEELADLDMRDRALAADSLVSARKIRQPIETADDILDAFDRITYDKGASVLAMFEAEVGAETFRRGVRTYLTARAFGNASSADFVSAISAVAGKDLAPDFATFLEQAGAPELEARLACERGGARVELAQRRYLAPGSPTPEDGVPWSMPVCIVYDRDGKRAEACTKLDAPTGALALPAKACPRWLLANANGRGYYRLVFTAAQVTALRDEGWAQLTWPERRAVFFDVADAPRRRRAEPTGGHLPLQLALSLVPKLLAGGDRFTIADAVDLPRALDRLVPDDLRAKFEAWLRATYGPGATRLGLAPSASDDLDAAVGRADLVRAAAWDGRDPALVNGAVALAERWRELDPPLRGLVLAIAVDASAATFARVARELASEPDRGRREDMLAALGGVRDPARQRAALELVLDPARDVRETIAILFAHASEAARAIAAQFYRDHAAALAKRLPRDEVAGGGTDLTALFTAACDAARRDEIAAYVTTTFGAQPGGPRVVKQAIEAMDQCIAARASLEPELRGWLAGYRIAKPDVKKPDARKPDARKPDARKSDVRKPDARKPDVRKPDARKPDARKPDARKPDAHDAAPGRAAAKKPKPR